MSNFLLQNILNVIRAVQPDKRVNVKFVKQIDTSSKSYYLRNVENYGIVAEVMVLLYEINLKAVAVSFRVIVLNNELTVK